MGVRPPLPAPTK